MVEPTADPEVREALTELDLYLSDTVPPLVVAGSAELLLRYPPELVAAAIRSWTGAQYGKGAGASVSDYLFHAVKKIHMLGEFRLVPRETLEGYLEGLKPLVLADCPEEDRGLLAENLSRLRETAAASTAAPWRACTGRQPRSLRRRRRRPATRRTGGGSASCCRGSRRRPVPRQAPRELRRPSPRRSPRRRADRRAPAKSMDISRDCARWACRSGPPTSSGLWRAVFRRG